MFLRNNDMYMCRENQNTELFGNMKYFSYYWYIKQKTYSIAHYIKDNGRNSKTNPWEVKSAILNFKGVFN